MKGHWEKGRYIIGNPKAASWTKWGGVRQGYQSSLGESPEWNCQVCGKKQLKLFPEYLLLLDDETREYLRICTECKFRSVVSNASTFIELKVEIQTKDIREYLSTLSMLMTLPVTL